MLQNFHNQQSQRRGPKHNARGNGIWYIPNSIQYCHYKRLDRGKFVWTQAADGVVLLTPAQLSTLLEGIDWRRVHRSASLEDDPQPPTVVV